jgi:hypothetical protein
MVRARLPSAETEAVPWGKPSAPKRFRMLFPAGEGVVDATGP